MMTAYQKAWRKTPNGRASYNRAQSKYRKTHLAERRKSAAKRRLRKRMELDVLKNRPCADCHGQFEPCQMDFDHRNPADKVSAVGVLVHCGSKLLLDEIAKCDLVCANCHRLRTYRQQRAKWAVRS